MTEFTIAPNHQGHQDQQVKKLKRFLEGWRMVVLPLKSVILWEQQWHPCAIVGLLSTLFLVIWLMDLNTLATVAVIGLILNFIDFIVPVVCNFLYGPTSWTGQHEKKFEDICKSIVNSYNNGLQSIQTFYSLRETNPYMYYIISISMLCTTAWVSSAINNIFLIYLLSTVMLLWPGLRQQGAFNMFFSLINKVPKGFLKTE